MRRLYKILLLPYQRKALLAQSFFTVWLVRLSLWLFPFKQLNEWLSRFDKTVSGNEPPNWVIVNNTARSIRACSRYVPSASCLTQALATRTLLRLRGQNSTLKIGVDKDENGKFMAHAWLEIDGKIIIGKLLGHHRFNVLSSSGSSVVI
jgi:hypothetical protein